MNQEKEKTFQENKVKKWNKKAKSWKDSFSDALD